MFLFCSEGECGPSIRGRRNLWCHLLQQRSVSDPHVAQLHWRWGMLSDVVSVVVSSLMFNIYECTCLSLSLKDFRKGMNAYLLKFQHKNASTGKRTYRKYFSFTWSRCVESLFWLLPVSHRGPMGLFGTGQWETHCCSDGLMDQANGLPHNSRWPGTGELIWLFDSGYALLFVELLVTTPEVDFETRLSQTWYINCVLHSDINTFILHLQPSSIWFFSAVTFIRALTVIFMILFLARWWPHPQDIAEEVLCQWTT